jgi:hypothetical protein
LAMANIHLNGSAEVQDYRRRAELARRKRESDEQNQRKSPYIPRADDITIGAPGRQLREKDGGLVPIGTQE